MLAGTNPAMESTMAKTKQNKIKTNAMRLLDAHHIIYTTFTYAGDTFHSADEVAALLNIPVHQVYKTLVVLANGVRNLLVMLPADPVLALRHVARAVESIRHRLACQREQ